MAGEIDLSQFHEVFFEESFEGLATMESGLLNLNPGNPDVEIINNVFRAAHSIKGGAGTFGFQSVSDFTHVMETLLDNVRSGDQALSDELVQVLLESVDFLKMMLVAAQEKQETPEEDIAAFCDRLNSFAGQSGAANTTAAGTTSSDTATSAPDVATSNDQVAEDYVSDLGPVVWRISFKPDTGLFKSGNDPYRIFRELGELGELKLVSDISRVPDFTTLDPEDCYLSWEMTLTGDDVNRQDIEELFEWVADDVDIDLEQTEAADPMLEPTQQLPETLAPEPAMRESAQPTASFNPELNSIRVNIDRVDALVNLVGELVITQSMLSRFKEAPDESRMDELIRGIEQLEENTRQLQEQTMQIRMLPVDNVFQRMPRLVRDLSKSLGKDVALNLQGRSTEVDKTVLEKISDPITHLVRNSLDHGIETPEERSAKGKDTVGTITLNAFHEAGNIIIEVKDDGRGLDRDRILAKAIERGIVEPDDELTTQQIDQLIFSAGFSTSEEVSDVSGRGVGMDVVKNNIEQLNGHIDLYSIPDSGSVFSIKLPLTLAIIEGQLVRVGKDVFIIPLLSIVKSTMIASDLYNSIAGATSMYRLEDEYIPVVSLSEIYGIKADYTEDTQAILVIVDAVERFGVLVDEVMSQQQVVVKSLETNFRQVPTVSGATILGDGTVSMILDMPGVLRAGKESKQRREIA